MSGTNVATAEKQSSTTERSGGDAPRNSPKLRRLGIHGARGTGKTCYLACIYGHRAADQTAITVSTDHSINHLQAVWKVLEAGNPSDATGLSLPTELDLALHADGLAWNIATRDYAGALVQRSDTGMPELKVDVKEWLESSDAILLFVNIDGRADSQDIAIKDRHDELDLLITNLKKLSHDGNTVGRPLALLLTKWDTQGDLSLDAAHERKRALEYLGNRSREKCELAQLRAARFASMAAWMCPFAKDARR